MKKQSTHALSYSLKTITGLTDFLYISSSTSRLEIASNYILLKTCITGFAGSAETYSISYRAFKLLLTL
jgi:hypothetical protein